MLLVLLLVAILLVMAYAHWARLPVQERRNRYRRGIHNRRR